jgi:hypothetical protein
MLPKEGENGLMLTLDNVSSVLGIQLKTAAVISKNLLNCFALTENNQTFGIRKF